VGVEGDLAVQLSEPLFPEYEAAVDSFLHAGGHIPSVIHSPRSLINKYRSQFPGSLEYARGVQIKEVEQDSVSVSGTTIAGQEFEWPST
jgi:hypothetical protein